MNPRYYVQVRSLEGTWVLEEFFFKRRAALRFAKDYYEEYKEYGQEKDGIRIYDKVKDCYYNLQGVKI